VARVFGFEYRIEIYTPAAKRTYGYYVWPFLLDGELVARVDLKADRTAGALRVVGAFVESGSDPARVADALARELATMAWWLGLSDVAVGDRGDLVDDLRRRCQSGSGVSNEGAGGGAFRSAPSGPVQLARINAVLAGNDRDARRRP